MRVTHQRKTTHEFVLPPGTVTERLPSRKYLDKELLVSTLECGGTVVQYQPTTEGYRRTKRLDRWHQRQRPPSVKMSCFDKMHSRCLSTVRTGGGSERRIQHAMTGRALVHTPQNSPCFPHDITRRQRSDMGYLALV